MFFCQSNDTVDASMRDPSLVTLGSYLWKLREP